MVFTSIQQKYYDPKFDATAVTVLPGDYYVSKDPQEMLVTILGSCVAACIRDKKLGVGGMNHFLLPSPGVNVQTESGRYGSFAMEELINALLKMGSKREHFEAKVFGGASVIQSSIQIGQNNSDFVREYLEKERIPVISEDLGGDRPRRIHFWPSSGRVARHLLQNAETRMIMMQESAYQKKISERPRGNGVELF
ncbi:MAG: Chemoreceptor glutamine deamidase CheD [Holosporales bacterium]